MDAKRITTGIIFLFIGIILLLSKMDIIDFNWFEVFRYWPLLIILVGVNILVPKKDIGYIISIGTTCVILSIFTYIGITTPNQSFLSRIMENNHVDIDMDEEDFKGTSNFVSSKNSGNITHATANIDLGATQIKLKDTTESNLFEATNNSNKYFLSLNSDSKEGQPITLNLSGKTKKGINSKGNTTLIKLNKNIIWDLNLDVGAADIQGDLSNFKLRNLTIDAGASNLDLKLGYPQINSNINIDAGASSIQIAIPRDAACQIITEMALSSVNADDSFIKGNEKGTLTSPNFDKAKNKFQIAIDGGITSVSITRY
ncbi:LiaI-LiaF-like domain-containing protein [Sphingobacterium faecium]|uniref:LiaI-LiaF-like domain-containing protein n=1 Tax=Sphingobacterium faecium TaxID=34087 RepID=UPI003209F9AD